MQVLATMCTCKPLAGIGVDELVPFLRCPIHDAPVREQIPWGYVWKAIDAVMPSLARFPEITGMSKAAKEEFALAIIAHVRNDIR